eukprot:jgi/Botrbrau1/22730/Bobra.0132s0068.1
MESWQADAFAFQRRGLLSRGYSGGSYNGLPLRPEHRPSCSPYCGSLKQRQIGDKTWTKRTTCLRTKLLSSHSLSSRRENPASYIVRERCIIVRMSAAASNREDRPPAVTRRPKYFLGLDFGTSGARAIAIDEKGSVVADLRERYGETPQLDWVSAWEGTLYRLLDAIPSDVKQLIVSLAFDGTSATALLLDRRTGAVLQPPKLYNESQSSEIVNKAKVIAPPAHTATASTSTLCKLLTWDAAGVWQEAAGRGGDVCAVSPGGLAGLSADWPERHHRLEQCVEAGLRPSS